MLPLNPGEHGSQQDTGIAPALELRANSDDHQKPVSGRHVTLADRASLAPPIRHPVQSVLADFRGWCGHPGMVGRHPDGHAFQIPRRRVHLTVQHPIVHKALKKQRQFVSSFTGIREDVGEYRVVLESPGQCFRGRLNLQLGQSHRFFEVSFHQTHLVLFPESPGQTGPLPVHPLSEARRVCGEPGPSCRPGASLCPGSWRFRH